jgi:hypothetical protein
VRACLLAAPVRKASTAAFGTQRSMMPLLYRACQRVASAREIAPRLLQRIGIAGRSCHFRRHSTASACARMRCATDATTAPGPRVMPIIGTALSVVRRCCAGVQARQLWQEDTPETDAKLHRELVDMCTVAAAAQTSK